MNAGATADRVYEALREMILGHDFRPGDRIDPAGLAEDLVASVTPVRDALHRLVGEDLVEARQGAGFFLPSLDEPALQDLYAWSGELVQLALRGWRGTLVPIELADEPQAGDGAEEVTAILSAIAVRSVNAEHCRALGRVNARLHAVRVIETHVLDGVEAELCELRAAALAMDGHRLTRLSRTYHRRRLRAAAELVRAVYRLA